MRFVPFLLLALPCICLAQGGSSPAATDKEDLSYAVGHKLGIKVAAEMPLDIASFVHGFWDGAEGKDSKVSEAETERIISEFQKAAREYQSRISSPDAKSNLAEGREYLERNKTKKGVKVTASGLQYEVLKEGAGESPDKSCIVTVRYEGRSVNGKVFDSAGWPNSAPTRFLLGETIPGWIEGLQLMRPGAKYRFVIPSELAYGESGAGTSVEPNETLIFEVELLEFEPFG